MKLKCKKIFALVVFLLVFSFLFATVQEVMRPKEAADYFNLKGFEKEEKLDAVFVGGSSIFVYWQPLKAWDDFGFTSYNFATNAARSPNLLNYVKEVVRKQGNEPVIVIDAKQMAYCPEILDEATIRFGSDNLSQFSPYKYELINTAFKHNKKEGFKNLDDKLSYYFDLIKYHTELQNLKVEEYWDYALFGYENPLKGFEYHNLHYFLHQPKPFTSTEKVMDESAKKYLTELLEFGKKENLKMAFVVSPFVLNEEEHKSYNALQEMVEDYGFKFLDCNQHYEEMGLDFETDFYNRNHVNIFGAQKFTSYVGNYLVKNFKLKDHSDDNSYKSWHEAVMANEKDEKEAEEIVSGLIRKSKKIRTIGKNLPTVNSLTQWSTLTDNADTVLFIAKKGKIGTVDDLAERSILSSWEISDGSKNVMSVVNKNAAQKRSKGNMITGNTGKNPYLVPYTVSIENSVASVSIDGKLYENSDSGIYIVAMEKQSKDIVDEILITNENGKLVINR